MKANQPVKLFLKEETYISSKPNAHPLTLEGYRNPKGLATHTNMTTTTTTGPVQVSFRDDLWMGT